MTTPYHDKMRFDDSYDPDPDFDRPTRAEAEADDGGILYYEAECELCHEHFNPADDNDLIHLEKENGEECGGTGTLLGYYKGRVARIDTDPVNDSTLDAISLEDRVKWLEYKHDRLVAALLRAGIALGPID